MGAELENPAPVVYEHAHVPARAAMSAGEWADEDAVEPVDRLEVFELLKDIRDPEHPHSLHELHVVQYDLIHVDNDAGRVRVSFTPTIPHCSMATLIGLCLRVKLLRSLPPRFKIDIAITPGTHNSEEAVNKQLNDKERVAAALENNNLLSVVHGCLGDPTE